MRFFRAVLPLVLVLLTCALVTVPASPAGAVEVETVTLLGPLDAERSCPRVCAGRGGTWDGKWRSGIAGKAYCGCTLPVRANPATRGASCSAGRNGGCGGCSVTCAPGRQPICLAGRWDGLFNRCERAASCGCR